MGSFCNRRHGDPSIFTPRETHFFKIILEDVIDSKKLMFPKKFVMENGSSLAREAILKVPSGVVWKMDLLKCNGDVWLGKGWQEFSDYHTLRFGDFVVFKYHGNSEFSVVILDTSTTEIQYPITGNNTVKHNHDEGFQIPVKKEIDVDIADENLDDLSPNPRKREKSSVPCSPSRPYKMMRSCSTENKGKGKVISGLYESHFKGDALRPRDFKSENPFFKRAMKLSHIQPRGAVKIPLWFSSKYIGKNAAHVTLSLLGGKSWKVKLYYSVHKGEKRANLAKGWSVFVKDNSLAVNDLCAFELLKGPKIALKVSIFRKAEGSCHPLPGLDSPVGKGSDKKKSATGIRKEQSLTSGEKRDALQRACSAFKSKKPILRILLQPSYIGRLHVPQKFFDEHVLQGSHIMLQVGNKCWRVKLLSCGSNQRHTYFSAGWRKFVSDNSVKVGDVCVFELIDRKNAILKVFISRYAG